MKVNPSHAFRHREMFYSDAYIVSNQRERFNLTPDNMTEDAIIVLYRQILYNSRVGLINQNELIQKLESILQENPKTIQF